MYAIRSYYGPDEAMWRADLVEKKAKLVKAGLEFSDYVGMLSYPFV